MFQSVLKTILNSTLGKFLKIGEINIGLSGIVELRDVEINAKTIETFLPISIKLGRIGHLKIQLSWLGLLSTPVKVEISDVYAVVALPKDGDINLDEINEKIIQQKLEALISWELLNFPEKEVESDKGTLMKTIDTIIDHVTVSVERVHIVFEEQGINAGIVLGSAKVYPVDEHDKQLFSCADSSVVARRKIEVADFGIYFNIDPIEAARGAAVHQLEREQKSVDHKTNLLSLYGTSSQSSSLQEYNRRKGTNDPYASLLAAAHAEKEHSKVGYHQVDLPFLNSIWDSLTDQKWAWILPPLSITVHFNMWKGTMEKLQQMDPPRPAMEAYVTISAISLSITKQQYQGILTLLAQFVNNPASLAMLKLQSTKNVDELLLKHGTLDDERRLAVIDKGLEYVQFYKRNFQGYTVLEQKDLDRLKVIETEQPLTQILTWRSIALKVVQIEYEQEDKPFWRPKPASGFFSSWFGGTNTGPKPPAKNVDVELIKAYILDYAAIQHEEEKKAMKNIKAHYVKILADVKLAEVTINLVNPDRSKILSFGVFDLGTQVKLYPNSTGVTATIDRLEATDYLTKDAIIRSFIRKSQSEVVKGQPFVNSSISIGDKHLNPETGYDMVIKARVTGIDIFVNLPLLLNLATFFTPPKHFTIASRVKNEMLTEFLSIQSSIQSNAITTLESRGRQMMDIQIAAPTVIIPTDVTNAASHNLVITLGELSIKATPPTIESLKQQKILIAKAYNDNTVLTNLSREKQKELFYDTFDMSLSNVSVYIGDPKYLYQPDDAVFIVRPMQIDLGVSLSLLAASSSPTSPNSKTQSQSSLFSSPKSNEQLNSTELDHTALQMKKLDLVIPQLLLTLSLPSVDVQISPLKIARLLRLTKSLLNALKLSTKTQEDTSTKLTIEEIVDQNYTIIESIDSLAASDAILTPVNPEMTSMLISVQLGRVSFGITNDLVPLFPVNILFSSMEGVYVAVAMRSLDMDVSFVLKSIYVEDCLNQYGGSNRFILAGTSRPLLNCDLNKDTSYMMTHMLNHAFPYNDELPTDQTTRDAVKKSGRRASVNASSPAPRRNSTTIQSASDLASILGDTAIVNHLQQAVDTQNAVIDSAFLSCHVSLPQKTSPLYVFVSTLVTAHFGKVAMSINRESIPPLMMFFAKQLLPNPSIVTAEDKLFGQVGLDFMQDIQWGDQETDSSQCTDQFDENNQDGEKKKKNMNENDTMTPISEEETDIETGPNASNIDPILGFDPDLLLSGAELAEKQRKNGQFVETSETSMLQTGQTNVGFDVHRISSLIHAPNVSIPTRLDSGYSTFSQRSKNKVKKSENEKKEDEKNEKKDDKVFFDFNAPPPESNDAFSNAHDVDDNTTDDDNELLGYINTFLDDLIDIDENEYNVHFFGLVPSISPAYPAYMLDHLDYIKLIAMYDQEESDILATEGENADFVLQTFRNEKMSLRNTILRSELTILQTIADKFKTHTIYLEQFRIGLIRETPALSKTLTSQAMISNPALIYPYLTPSTQITVTSTQLLHLHQFINTKTLLRLSRLKQRQSELNTRTAAFLEKVQIANRIRHYEGLLSYRRSQLLALRQFERKVRALRRLGGISNLLCLDTDELLTSQQNAKKLQSTAVQKNMAKNTQLVEKNTNNIHSNPTDSDDDFQDAEDEFIMQTDDDTFPNNQSGQKDQQNGLLDTVTHERVGIFCIPLDYSTRSISLQEALRIGDLMYITDQENDITSYNALWDEDTFDTICPLIPAKRLDLTTFEQAQKYTIVPFDVLARVTFGGISMTLTTQNVPILDFSISTFKLGFGMHSYGMSIKLIIGTLSLRQPSENILLQSQGGQKGQKGDQNVHNEESYTKLANVTQTFVNKAIDHQLTRQAFQKAHSQPYGIQMGQQQMQHVLFTQMYDLKSYIETNYKNPYANKFSPLPGQGKNKGAGINTQRYQRFIYNRQNYKLFYPDIMYTTQTQSLTQNNTVLNDLASSPKQHSSMGDTKNINTHKKHAQKNAQADGSKSKLTPGTEIMTNENKAKYMLNIALFMRSPEAVVFDDTDEYDYYSLMSVHNLLGLDDLALGLTSDETHAPNDVHNNPTFNIQGRKVVDSNRGSQHSQPMSLKGQQLLTTLSRRQSVTSNTMSALKNINFSPDNKIEPVNTAIVTSLPFNVPAFILTNPDHDVHSPKAQDGQSSLSRAAIQGKLIPTMVVHGHIQGIRIVVCYKVVDNLLKYIQGLDKCVAAVMNNNSYTNTMKLTRNRIRQQGDLLRTASLISHISTVASFSTNSMSENRFEDDDTSTSRRNTQKSDRDSYVTDFSNVPIQSRPHLNQSQNTAFDTPNSPSRDMYQTVTRKAHVDPALSIDTQTLQTPRDDDIYSPTSPNPSNMPLLKKQDTLSTQNRQKKLTEIGQAQNHLNNATNPEKPRTFALLMDISLEITNIAIIIPASSTSMEMIAISLDKLSISSSSQLTQDYTTSKPLEGATFFATSNTTNTAVSNTAQNVTKQHLSRLLQQQASFQRQTSLSKVAAHRGSVSSPESGVSSLKRQSSLLGRENSMSLNSESFLHGLRSNSLVHDDDDEFYDAEELTDSNTGQLQLLLDSIDSDQPFGSLTNTAPSTFMSQSTIPTDTSIFYQLAQHVEAAKDDKIHGLGLPSQTYEYRNIQIDFHIALSGISITTLLLVTPDGMREQIAAPRFQSILAQSAAAGSHQYQHHSQAPQSPQNGHHNVENEYGTGDDAASLTLTAMTDASTIATTPVLKMIDLLAIGDIELNATHFAYIPFIIISPPPSSSSSQTKPIQPEYSLFHTAHTFFPHLSLPDWAVSMALDNVDLIVSQSQLSLLLSLISTHSTFPGNLGEKSILKFPPYQPATASTTETTISLRQIQFYSPLAQQVPLELLHQALKLLHQIQETTSNDGMTQAHKVSLEQTQALLQALQQQSFASKIAHVRGSGSSSGSSMSQNASTRGTNAGGLQNLFGKTPLNSRISRIGNSRLSRRSQSSRGAYNPNYDSWGAHAAEIEKILAEQERLSGSQGEKKKESGIGVSVSMDINRCSIQVITNPTLDISPSMAFLISMKVRLNMLPDGTIALVSSLDDICIVNAALPTSNPSLLKPAIRQLPVSHAIIKPFSCVTSLSFIPSTFNHTELLAPLPKLFTKSTTTHTQQNTKIKKLFTQTTRFPGAVAQQVLNVSCVVTDIDIKISYSDYEMLMEILGTLTAQALDDFNITIQHDDTLVSKNDALTFDPADIQHQNTTQSSSHVLSSPETLDTTVSDTQTSSPGGLSALLYSMGDMTVSFLLPTCTILLVNDSPGFPLPFMRIHVSDIATNVNAFGHRRDVLLKLGSSIEYHNGSLVAWEPLLEPSRYEIAVVQSITHPMIIQVKSLSKIDINVTRTMMDGLAQSLSLLSSAQQSQSRKLQAQLAGSSGENEFDGNDETVDFEENFQQTANFLQNFENIENVEKNHKDEKNQNNGLLSSPGSNSNSSPGSSPNVPEPSTNSSMYQLYHHKRLPLEKHVIQTILDRKQNSAQNGANFSFFKLDNNTEFNLYYSFGAHSTAFESLETYHSTSMCTTPSASAAVTAAPNTTHQISSPIAPPQLIDSFDLKQSTILSLFDESNRFYDKLSALSQLAQTLVLQVRNVEHGGYLPSSPHYHEYKRFYDNAIAKQREIDQNGGQNGDQNDQKITLPTTLTKAQKRRLVRFNIIFASWTARLASQNNKTALSLGEISSDPTEVQDGKKDQKNNQNNQKDQKDKKNQKDKKKSQTQKSTSHTASALASLTSAPLFFHENRQDSSIIDQLMSSQQKQALSLMKLASNNIFFQSSSNPPHKVRNLSSRTQQLVQATNKLISIQIDGYKPVHNIQVETIGCQSYMLHPGPHVINKQLEPLAVLIDVNVVQGIKVIAIRSARAMVNFLDIPIEIAYGVNLTSSTIAFPGETFYFPLSTQSSLIIDPNNTFEDQAPYEISPSFVSIRPVTLHSVSHTHSTRSVGRTMIAPLPNNVKDLRHAHSTHKFSFPLDLTQLINGTILVSEASLDDTSTTARSDFIALIHRWRQNGLTYWALCPPVSITNLLSERAVITLSTKPRTTQGKKVKTITIDHQGGHDIFANLAPTHSLRCYAAAPSCARISTEYGRSTKDIARDTFISATSSHTRVYSEKVTSESGGATAIQLYMSLSIPTLSLVSKEPICISQSNSTSYHLYFDLVHKAALANHFSNPKKFTGDLRILTVHCEVTQSQFLSSKKTTQLVNVPSISNAAHLFTTTWTQQSQSALISVARSDIAHQAYPSTHNLPSVHNAGLKLVLFTPYWIFDTSNLGLVVSESERINNIKHFTPTQYDSVNNVQNSQQDELEMLAKLRLYQSVNEASLQDQLNTEYTRAVAMGTNLSLYNPLHSSDGHVLGQQITKQDKNAVNNDRGMSAYISHQTGAISVSSMVPSDNTNSNTNTNATMSTPTQNAQQSNKNIMASLNSSCYKKATMFSGSKHAQIPSLQVFARLTKPTSFIVTPQTLYPPQETSHLPKENDLQFLSEPCELFSLDAVGVSKVLEFQGIQTHQLMISGKKDKMVYSVGVLIRNGQDLFNRTRQIFFSPRLIIINKLPLPIIIRQHCLDDLAQLKTQSSTINTRFNALANAQDKATAQLAQSTPDNHSIDNHALLKLNHNDPLVLEGQFHANACFHERTQRFIPSEQVELFHWSHSKEERLISFKLLTNDDPFKPVLEEQAKVVYGLAIDSLRTKVMNENNHQQQQLIEQSVVSTDSPDTTTASDQQTIFDQIDINALASPVAQLNAFTLQTDNHNTISSLPSSSLTAQANIAQSPTSVVKKGTNNNTPTSTTPWDDGIWGWSGYVNPDQLGDQTLTIRNPVTGKSFIVKMRVLLTAPDIRNGAGSTITVVFEPQDLVFPQYRIENKSCSDTIRIAQDGCQEWTTLRPYESTVYTWDQPLLDPILQVDITSGKNTVHCAYNIDELGSKGTIIIPGESSGILNLLTGSDEATGEENGPNLKTSKKIKKNKNDTVAENVLYNQHGGINPILNNQSKRDTHTLFVYVRNEGPTRVLIISDFPSANNEIDLVTSQLLNTSTTQMDLDKLYDQYRIGHRGVEIGQLLHRWDQLKHITSTSVTTNTNLNTMGVNNQDGPQIDQNTLTPTPTPNSTKLLLSPPSTPHTPAHVDPKDNHMFETLREEDFPGPHGIDLVDRALLSRAQSFESTYLDDFCSTISVLQHYAHSQGTNQHNIRQSMVSKQFGYEDWVLNDQTTVHIAKLTELFPGLDLWDPSLSELDIEMLSKEKHGSSVGVSQAQLAGIAENEKQAQILASANQTTELSASAQVGADVLPLTASELVNLVKVRAQTIKSMVVKFNNVQYQTSIVNALAKYTLAQTQNQPQGQGKQGGQGNVTNLTGILSTEENNLIAHLKEDVAYLAVNAIEARWLTPASISGLSDCYAMITFNNQTYKTPIVQKTLNPFWEAEMFFKIEGRLLRELRVFQQVYLQEQLIDPTNTNITLPTTPFNEMSLRIALFHKHLLLPDTFLGGIILSTLDCILVSQFSHEYQQLLSTRTAQAQGLAMMNNTSPVLMLNRWFKLHALRHNKLLHGQAQLSFGLVTNELMKQRLILYQLEQDLLDHVLLLARLTLKYRVQLQSIDVGVLDLNTLQLLPQLHIPMNPAFVAMVKGRENKPPKGAVKKKKVPKVKNSSNWFPTKLTMTPIGPIRCPVPNFVTLYKKHPGLLKHFNSARQSDPNAPHNRKIMNSPLAKAMLTGRSGGPGQIQKSLLTPKPSSTPQSQLIERGLPQFIPISLHEDQTVSVLTELAQAALKQHDDLIEAQKEVTVCIALEDMALDTKHLFDCLLKEDKLLPQWVPRKIVGVIQCNGHVSKVDLYDITVPQIARFSSTSQSISPSPSPSPSSSHQSDQIVSKQNTIDTQHVASSGLTRALDAQKKTIPSVNCDDGDDSINDIDTAVPPSVPVATAQPPHTQFTLHVGGDGDDDDMLRQTGTIPGSPLVVEDVSLDYVQLLTKETNYWLDSYGIQLHSHLGPTQGALTVVPLFQEDEDEAMTTESTSTTTTLGGKNSTNSPEVIRSMSNIPSLAALSVQPMNISLNKCAGPQDMFTFTIPLSLIKSYVDPVNNSRINTSHLSSYDIPSLTMTIMVEIEQDKEYISTPSAVLGQSTSTSTPVSSETTPPLPITSMPSHRLVSPFQVQTDENEEEIDTMSSVGFSTPLKAAVHLADIDVPLVDLQYIDIYDQTANEMITMYDPRTGTPYKVDSLGRRADRLLIESHYYFARRQRFYECGPHSAANPSTDVPFSLTERFTERVLKPPTPIANLSESEIINAKNLYSTNNPHVLAAYLYQVHLDTQLTNYLEFDAEYAHVNFIREQQQRICELKQKEKKIALSADEREKLDLLETLHISHSAHPEDIITDIDADQYPLLRRVPLSPVRCTIKAHIQTSKPLIERSQMQLVLDIPHFGLSLVDSTLGRSNELLYISSRGLLIELEDSLSQRAIELKVQSFQIDQCIDFSTASGAVPAAIKETSRDSEKIIFGPSETALQSGQPFVHISLNQTKTPLGYPVQVFKYATILIQEMAIRVDEALVWHLLRFSNDILPSLASSTSQLDTNLGALVVDERILYQPQNIASTALFYFSVLHIQPISIFFTFKVSPDIRSAQDDLTFNPIQAVLKAAGGILGNIDAAPICMQSLLIKDAAGDIATLIYPIVQFYVSQGIREGYKVLGSFEFLGNPVSLVSGVGSGVKDFFYEPAQGLVSSPKDFGTGLVKGSASLVRSLTTGLFGAASKVTGSVGKGLSTLTMDSNFQAQRRARNSKKVKHAGDGLLQGTKAFSYGLFAGISGIVINPLEGARSGGAKGFLVGIATGLTGVVTKTASGALDLLSLTLQGLGNTFKLFDEDIEPSRARFPRFISRYGSMKSYDVAFALGYFMVQSVPPPTLDGTVKQVFTTITGLGGNTSNFQREDEVTMKDVVHHLGKDVFYDVDVNGANISNNLSSSLVELEALLSTTAYGIISNPSVFTSAGNGNNPITTTTNLDEKQRKQIKSISESINNRLKLIASATTEDLVTCYIVNDVSSSSSSAPTTTSLNDNTGLHPNATVVVVTTRRMIAANVGDIVIASREGGSIPHKKIKFNLLLDHVTDMYCVLPDHKPIDKEKNQRLKAQQTTSSTLLPKNRVPKKDAKKSFYSDSLATSYLCITSTTNSQDNDKQLKTYRLPIHNALECQTTTLSIQSYLQRPVLLSARFGGKDISNIFASQFYNVPATPNTLCALSNRSTDLYESIILGPHKPTTYPIPPNNEEYYYPTESQIKSLFDLYHIPLPAKVTSTNVRFDQINIRRAINTIRTFDPVQHGRLPLVYNHTNAMNRNKGVIVQTQSLFDPVHFTTVDASNPSQLQLYSFPQTTLRTSPTLLALRKPTNMARGDWYNKFTTNHASSHHFGHQLSPIEQEMDKIKAKVLSITYTIGSHVVTREYTPFDESIIIL